MRPPASMTKYFSSAIGSGEGAGVGLAATLPPHAPSAMATTRQSHTRVVIPLRRYGAAWGSRRSANGPGGSSPTHETRRVGLVAEREDLVVDPAGAENRLLRVVPRRRAGWEVRLLPHHDPHHALRVGDAHELTGQPVEVALLERKAQHQSVARIRLPHG